MGKTRNAHKILVENLKECAHFGDLGINGRITLKYSILKK
jgi:hypothetical protein